MTELSLAFAKRTQSKENHQLINDGFDFVTNFAWWGRLSGFPLTSDSLWYFTDSAEEIAAESNQLPFLDVASCELTIDLNCENSKSLVLRQPPLLSHAGSFSSRASSCLHLRKFFASLRRLSRLCHDDLFSLYNMLSWEHASA